MGVTGAQDHRGGQGTGQQRRLLTVTPSVIGEFLKLSMAMGEERTFHPLLEISILDVSTHRRDLRPREDSIREDQEDKEQLPQEDNQTEAVKVFKPISTKETHRDSFHNKQDNNNNLDNNNNNQDNNNNLDNNNNQDNNSNQDNNKASTKVSTPLVLTVSPVNP